MTEAEVGPDSGGRIVVGVTGGIAAYKAVSVIRELVLHGCRVDVVATPEALRFVGAPTFAAISHHRVHADLFADAEAVEHVALARLADAILIVPATANTIAKLAAGIADDLIGTTVLASTAPLIIAPAMHTAMWEHLATRENVGTLVDRGAILVGPDSGRLTGDDVGAGRLADPETIADAVLGALPSVPRGRESATSGRDLEGVRVLVTAGGTREPIDPVRFLGNRSSGKQGVAVARRAIARGAEVTLVAANVEVPLPEGARLVHVASAAQMATACTELAPRAEVVIMAAAVADYRPVHVEDDKIKKERSGDELTIRFTRNPDILRILAGARRPGQTIIGFAAETEADPEARLRLGLEKLRRKGCDYLVMNRVGWNVGFRADETRIDVLSAATGGIVASAEGEKSEVADAILDLVAGGAAAQR